MDIDFPFPDKQRLEKQYVQNNECREALTRDFADFVEKDVLSSFSHLSVKARAKSFQSYFKKYLRYLKDQPQKKTEPLIPDQIGLRIVCPFLEDLPAVEAACAKYLKVLEVERKGALYSFKEFGYESVHLLVEIPKQILEAHSCAFVNVAEVQIRTILQDAWAEVEHELVYKPEFTPYGDQLKRRLAAVNAMLTLADTVFQEVRSHQRQFRFELDKRHESFFNKVEESTSALFMESASVGAAKDERFDFPAPSESASIDDLLLNALYAHNKGHFDRAIDLYGKILVGSPPSKTAAIIYNHRGMAHFAKSHYDEAAADFSAALELDAASYKAAYYRAVILQVKQEYAAALNGFSSALKIYPYQPWAYYRRAQVYFHTGDYPASLADCDSALALRPDFDGVQKLKALLLEKLKM